MTKKMTKNEKRDAVADLLLAGNVEGGATVAKLVARSTKKDGSQMTADQVRDGLKALGSDVTRKREGSTVRYWLGLEAIAAAEFGAAFCDIARKPVSGEISDKKSKGKAIYDTREQWLVVAAQELVASFEEQGASLDMKHLQFATAPLTGRRLGECWPKKAADDSKTIQVLICSKMGDPIQVLATLVHELCHACNVPEDWGVKKAHNKVFGRIARAMGLEGKLTATHAGEDLEKSLKELAKKLGRYPHVVVTRPEGRKVPPTMNFRSTDEEYEDYRICIKVQYVLGYGAPLDPAGNPMVPAGRVHPALLAVFPEWGEEA